MSTRLELLEKTREYLSDPAHWTQGCGWRNVSGDDIPMAVGYEGEVASACIAGAICLVDPDKVPFKESPFSSELNTDWKISIEAEQLIDLMDEHLRLNYNHTDFVTAFNDHSTYEEVLAFLDEMIDLEQMFAEGRESDLDSDIVLV